jgi:molybdopterin converting factor subunit 1
MILHVKLFATLREKAQAGKLVLEFNQEQVTVAELIGQIALQKPFLAAALKSVLVAVNQEFAFSEQLISAGDEIALFPPVSGG